MGTQATSASYGGMINWIEHRLGGERLFWTAQLVGWSGFGIVMLGWALAFWPLSVALLNKVLLVLIGVLISIGFRVAYRGMRNDAWRLPHVGLAVLGASFSAAPIWYWMHRAAFGMLCRTIGAVSPLSEIAHRCTRPLLAPWPVPTETWLFYGFVLTTWSLLYFLLVGLRELRQAQWRATRSDASAMEARLQVLQTQLEPHFLFNALNAISTLVTAGRPDEANAMLNELSEFLRATVLNRGTTEVRLETELNLVRRYIGIQKYRFADRLRMILEVEPAAMTALVPTLLLQPIVENAVRHGILPKTEGGSVSIRAATRDGRLLLSVEDDGAGFSRNGGRLNGVGLTLTRRRLHERYGNRAVLQLETAAGGGAIVQIELPLQRSGAAPRGS